MSEPHGDTTATVDRTRFVVYGAGAIGGILGARLHESGCDVTLVARGLHYEAIRSGGLRLVEPDGTVKVLAIPVVDRIAAAGLRRGDVVFLAMKGQDAEGAVRELAAAAPEGIAVACVQNGVEGERIALRRFDAVYGILVFCPGVHLDPGVVEVNTGPIAGILDVGRYPRGSDGAASSIAETLRRASYLSEVRDEIMPWKYAKLLRNINNALIALAGPEAPGSTVGKLIRAEGETVLRAAGIPFIPLDEFDARTRLLPRRLSGRPGNSSWQSVARRTGSIETDYLNGEIVLLARRHGVPAPVNELLQRMARELVIGEGQPGSVPVEQIFDRLGPNARPLRDLDGT